MHTPSYAQPVPPAEVRDERVVLQPLALQEAHQPLALLRAHVHVHGPAGLPGLGPHVQLGGRK